MSEAEYAHLLRLGVKHLVRECGVNPRLAYKVTKKYLDDVQETDLMLEFARENGWNEIVEGS
jgi:hypothetical protein